MRRFCVTPAAGLVLAVFFAAPLGAEIFEQVLVKVNGEIITKSEFEQRQIAELRNRPELGNVTANSPQLRAAINEITPDLILTAVDEPRSIGSPPPAATSRSAEPASPKSEA